MANLPSSGAISINSIKSLFGGPASPSLANYYRGGAYIPATKSVTVTEGEYYNINTWYWNQLSSAQIIIKWNNTQIFNGNGNFTSYSSGGYIYYRGTFRQTVYPYTGPYSSFYGVYRTYVSTVNINTGIPSSGQISLSQFYGAEKP